MPDCETCHQPIPNKYRRPVTYSAKYCSYACKNEALRIYGTVPCKVCKTPFRKRRKVTVCCSTECRIISKRAKIDKDDLIKAMLELRYGDWPNWTKISKVLKCSDVSAINRAKEYGLIDAKRNGPIVDGQYLPIPDIKRTRPINHTITAKETIEEELLINRKIDENECWLWMARKDERGYGIMHLPRPKNRDYPVKLLAMHVWGNVPLEGRYVFNKCNVKACFNPKHLIVRESRAAFARLVFKDGKYNTKGSHWIIDLPMAMDIKDAIELGETNIEISKRLKVKCSIIRSIRIKKTWKKIWTMRHEYTEK